MGYTIEKGKIVIWTEKRFVADEPWPNDDEGENYTYFYHNLRDRTPIVSCLARLSEEEKRSVVKYALQRDDFILKSKHSHFKKKKQQH